MDSGTCPSELAILGCIRESDGVEFIWPMFSLLENKHHRSPTRLITCEIGGRFGGIPPKDDIGWYWVIKRWALD